LLTFGSISNSCNAFKNKKKTKKKFKKKLKKNQSKGRPLFFSSDKICQKHHVPQTQTKNPNKLPIFFGFPTNSAKKKILKPSGKFSLFSPFTA
jgi:hypothetical protein